VFGKEDSNNLVIGLDSESDKIKLEHNNDKNYDENIDKNNIDSHPLDKIEINFLRP